MAANFIKKIWLGKADSAVHFQFVRFSKGIFENRAVIIVSKGKTVKLCSTFEFANDIVSLVSGLPDVKFSGLILSREGLNEILMKNGTNSEETKKKGLFVYNVGNLPSTIINEINSKVYFMLLDAEAPGISLKIKKRLPKPGKSGKEKVDDKFCVLETDEKFFQQVHDDLLFDLPSDFKKARITHAYNITDIILPKGEKDFEQLRLKAKRKGKIARSIEIDGKITKKEKEFEA